MDTLGIGTDIVKVERIAGIIERRGERALKRLFLPSEIEYCGQFANSPERFAGRFAAKEAVAKALGTGLAGGVNFSGIEILNGEYGAPIVRLSGKTAEVARKKGVKSILLSISHDGGYAVAFAVARG